MKLLAATTALAVVIAASAAANAQTPPPTPEADATKGTVTVQGVPPSKVLGAIDTSKLVDQPSPGEKTDAQAKADADPNNLTAQVQAEQSTKPLAKTADAKGVTTKPDPNDITHSDHASASTGAVGVQTASLPAEVTATIADGKYTTRDLVQAQLEAVKNAPPLVQPTITTTTVILPSQDSNVFDGAQRPGDWSQSASSTPANPG